MYKIQLLGIGMAEERKTTVYNDVCRVIGRAVVLLNGQVITERTIWLMLKAQLDQLDDGNEYMRQIYSTAISWMEERM
ncbi:DUF2767 domain-containing protein [Xenorhabdus sp. BG5]|uniref:DUF2767 domain-containing protein n=1 Tax=Xenorhabdus sp. BG5 TaxID=2782014 RepID=UPI001D151156|nr:DUF2767 domain-containing protein [Xenorhabdus sp. BG5]